MSVLHARTHTHTHIYMYVCISYHFEFKSPYDIRHAPVLQMEF